MSRYTLPAFVVIVIGIVAALVVVTRPSSRGTGTAASSPGPVTRDEAAQFDGYPLLWLGESFEGLPLTDIVRAISSDDPNYSTPTGQDAFYFIYGDCTPSADGGCAPPLQVLVTPRCFNPPEAYNYLKSGTTPVRGQGQLKTDIPGGPVLWTGGIAVSIYTSPERLDRVVAALEPINAAAMGSAIRSVVADAADPRSDFAAPTGGRCATIKGRDRSKVPYAGLND